MEKTKINKKILRQLWDMLSKWKWIFILALSFSLLDTFFNMLMPQIVRFTIDAVIDGDRSQIPDWLKWVDINAYGTWSLLWYGAAGIVIVALFSGISSYFGNMCTVRGSEGFVRDLRNRLFEHTQRIRYEWHTKHKTGDIIQRCTSDVDVIRGFVSGQMMEVFRIVILVAMSLFMMFSMDVWLTLAASIFIPIVIGYSLFFYRILSARFKVADEAGGELSAMIQENLTGVRVVRAFGRERHEIGAFDKKNDEYADRWLKLGWFLGYYWSFGDFMTGLQIMVIVVLGSLAAVDGRITIGQFMAFISYNAGMVWPIRQLGRLLSEMSKAGVSVDRVAYILEEAEEDFESGETPPMNRDLVFSHVSFQYNGEKELLRDVCFTVPAGKTYGILGGTGTGKSTLMHLLVRLFEQMPDSGEIRIGDVDIRKIRRSHLRKNVGIVLQEPFLFSRTVEENIKVSCPDAAEDEVRDCARIACVDDALSSFTNGYQTLVGERGVTLSGGQKQRVAIARMLMQKAPIMIFDDSLSALDTDTDAKIRKALRENLSHATAILISHRVTTLMQADHILVLEDGHIVEEGTHNELLERGGIYRSTYDMQLRDEDRIALAETLSETLADNPAKSDTEDSGRSA